MSILSDLRTIRITLRVIREMTCNHNTRNYRLMVMCIVIDQIVLRNRDFVSDSWLIDKTDLREQLIDGLQALRALSHPNLNQENDMVFETHREVKHRIRLLEDLATFLIKKAEEAQTPPLAVILANYAGTDHRAADEIPF